MERAIGIIGFGNMGSAIAEQLKVGYQILVFDNDKDKTNNMSGIKVSGDNVDLVNKVDTLILAVKPQDFDTVLQEIKDYVKGKLIISIAAGITTKYIEKRLGQTRVIRVMPNLPIKIGKGMSCISRGESAKEDDLNFTEKLFKKIGKTLILSESMMDAATAISGSGPGYFYDWSEGKSSDEIKKYAKEIFIPALTASAHELGFSSEESQILAEATGVGSVAFLEKTGLLPSELKKQVASKGGTTEAALEILHRGGSLLEAVKAAEKRAEELSRKEQ